MNLNKNLELLAPAGSFDTLRSVIGAGADAVYLGGSAFGARAYAKNFQEKELLEAIDYGHIHNRKIFLAVNTLLKNDEMKKDLYSYLRPYYEAGLDAVIVQDFGVFHFIKENFPKLPIHASTQMTVTSAGGAKFLKEQGASRIVTARELSLKEIRRIADDVDVEIESFIHGALCYCYSGQCLLSSMLGGRSGNRGRCAQPCRLPYTVFDQDGRVSNKKNPYILSLKDMNTLQFLPEIAKSGVFSFKIEGRMKSTAYAAGVVSVYRHYIDRYLAEGEEHYRVWPEDEKKLYDFGNRNGFTMGYYYDRNSPDMLTGNISTHSKADGAKLKEQVDFAETKEKIHGNLRLWKDSGATIEVSDGKFHVTVTGDLVQKAKSHPMSKENVLEKVRKTGNTPFVFETLTADMEEDVFLPVAALNHLRKEALEQLQEKRLEQYRRKLPHTAVLRTGGKMPQKKEHPSYLIVSTECIQGLDAALKEPLVDEIYLDAVMYAREHFLENVREDIEKCRKAGKKVFFLLPSVFRAKTAEFYESIAQELTAPPLHGFIARSYDALFYAAAYKRADMELRIDHSLYTYSDTAKSAFYQALPIQRDTAPLELNRGELRKRNNGGSEMLIYGYLPLMVTAGCIQKNVKKCTLESGFLYLKDRYGETFPVRNFCAECYNILYNSKPLFLLHQASDLESLHMDAYRIHFTVEDAQKAQSILLAYKRAFIEKKEIEPKAYLSDYTNGHYKRGVK